MKKKEDDIISPCKKCSLYKTCKTPMIQGVGSLNSRIMFIDEFPFSEDVGQIINELLKENNLKKEDIFFDNICKCKTPVNRSPKPTEIKACIPYLLEKIKEIKPNVIVPLGNTALKALTGTAGITYFQGKVLFHPKFDAFIIPLLHPSSLYRELKEGSYTHYIETNNHIKFIMEYSNKKLKRIKRKKILVENKNTFNIILNKLNSVSHFGFDIETEGFNYLEDKILGISLSYYDNSFYNFYIPDEYVDYEKLSLFMKNRTNLLVGQNIKFDTLFLRMKNVDILEKGFFDTMLASYLLNEDSKGYYGLKIQSWLHTDFGGYEDDLKKHLPKKGSFKDIPLSILSKYACLDAEACLRMFFKFKNFLIKDNLLQPFTLVLEAARLLVDIEMNGVRVDLGYLVNLQKEGFDYLDKIEVELKQITGDKDFNVRSHKQKKEMFQKLGIHSPKITKKGNPSFDSKALQLLKGKHVFVDKLLEHSDKYVLYNTHAKGVQEYIRKDGYTHPSFLLHGTVTGRLSCEGPNLQQVPKNKKFRNMYIPSPGNKIVEGDLSQAELRIIAHFSEDPTLMTAYMRGEDIHDLVAKELSVSRKISKGISFGLAYGRGPGSLSAELGISFDEAKLYIKRYFERFPRVQLYFRSEVERSKSENLINMFGRKRRLVSTFATTVDPKIINHTENQAMNFRIQSTASDITLTAAIAFRKKFGNKYRIIGLIHDSILLDVPSQEAEDIGKELKNIMENTVKLKVPIVADIAIMDRWGNNLEE